jgi:RNase P subunit RPR2
METIKIYKADEKKKCFCNKCNKITIGTFKSKEYHCKDGAPIKDILQLFCDECGKLAGIPYQSSVRVSKYIVNKSNKAI